MKPLNYLFEEISMPRIGYFIVGISYLLIWLFCIATTPKPKSVYQVNNGTNVTEEGLSAEDYLFALYPFINLDKCEYLKAGDKVFDKYQNEHLVPKGMIGYRCWYETNDKRIDNYSFMAYENKEFIDGLISKLKETK